MKKIIDLVKKITPLRALVLLLMVLPAINVRAGECFSESELFQINRKTPFGPVISAVEVHIDPVAQDAWKKSTHDFPVTGREVVTGAYLDDWLPTAIDPDFINKYYKQKQAEGDRFGIIFTEQTETLHEYATTKFKARYKRIVDWHRGFYFFLNPATGQAFYAGREGEGYCKGMELSSVKLLKYTSTRIPEWISPKSALAKLMTDYKKKRNFGTTLYGKLGNGDTLVLLSYPISIRNRGPYPYHFSGVVLIGDASSESKVKLVRDLMHVQYDVGAPSFDSLEK